MAAGEESEKIWSRIPRNIRNVVSNWAGSIFNAVVGFFLSPFVVHHLGNSAYGTWILIGSLTGYLGLLDLGVRGAVTRYVARYYAQEDLEETTRVVASALIIFLSTGVIAILAAVTLSVFAVRSFNIPPAYLFAAKVVLVIMGFNIAVSLVGGVFGGVMVGLHRFDLSNLIEIVSTIFRTTAIVLALNAGKGLIMLGLIQLTVAVGTALAYVWTVKHIYPELKVDFGKQDSRHFKLILSFSAFSFLLQISSILIYYSDSLVIGIFLPVSAVTFFAIAGNLLAYTRTIISGVSTTMTPIASALEARGFELELQRILLKVTRYTTLIILPIILTLMIRGKSFIRYWMGSEYAVLSGHVLWILALPLTFAAANQASTSTMLGISKHKVLVPVALGEALCNLGCSIALVHSLGVIGVAWGTAIPNLLVSLCFWPWYIHRALGISTREYVLSTWMKPIVSMVPFALCTYAIERLGPNVNLPYFFVEVACTLPLAFLGAWFIGVGPNDRQQFSEKILQPVVRAFRRA